MSIIEVVDTIQFVPDFNHADDDSASTGGRGKTLTHEQQMVRELLDAVIVKNQVAGALERVNKPEAKERRTRAQGKA